MTSKTPATLILALCALAVWYGAASAEGDGAPKPGEKRTNATDGAEMVWIPGGEFQMGSDPNEIDALWAKTGWDADWKKYAADESPKHNVKVDGFWMYATEVTNEQYGKFLKATQHREPVFWKDGRFNGPKQAAAFVSWDDAQAYCNWAGARLPTESEFEYALRGGDDRVFPWGNEYPSKTKCYCLLEGVVGLLVPSETGLTRKLFLKHVLLGYDNRYGVLDPVGYGVPDPVGNYPANPYGLFDLEGNVYEWCADWYDKYPLSTMSSDDFGQKYRVVRGGGCYCYPDSQRCAVRRQSLPDGVDGNLGFRCVPLPGRGP